MKALVYNGPRDVSISDVPDARVEQPTDVLVKITSTNICGSDLHIYEGRAPLERGMAIGHENLGEVIEVGQAVVKVKVGVDEGPGLTRRCREDLPEGLDACVVR